MADFCALPPPIMTCLMEGGNNIETNHQTRTTHRTHACMPICKTTVSSKNYEPITQPPQATQKQLCTNKSCAHAAPVTQQCCLAPSSPDAFCTCAHKTNKEMLSQDDWRHAKKGQPLIAATILPSRRWSSMRTCAPYPLPVRTPNALSHLRKVSMNL